MLIAFRGKDWAVQTSVKQEGALMSGKVSSTHRGFKMVCQSCYQFCCRIGKVKNTVDANKKILIEVSFPCFHEEREISVCSKTVTN